MLVLLVLAAAIAIVVYRVGMAPPRARDDHRVMFRLPRAMAELTVAAVAVAVTAEAAAAVVSDHATPRAA